MGTVTLHIVHALDIEFARAKLGIGNRNVGVLPVLDGGQTSADALADQVHGNVGEGDGHDLVDGVGFSAAQVVGEIADHGLFAGAAMNLFAERVADVHLFLVPVGIGFAIFGDRVPRHAAPSEAITNE